MIYLGIDPGTSRIGWGIIKKNPAEGEARQRRQNSKPKHQSDFKTVGFGCFDFSGGSHFEKLLNISFKIKELIEKYKPDILSIEKLFFAKNVKTALAVSEARGVIILEAVKKGLKIMEFTPLEVKISLTSYGRAEKNQVAQMTKLILNLKEVPKSDDAADALAVALTAAFVSRYG